MAKAKDEVGQTYGKLSVIERVSSDGWAAFRCRCECGTERVVRGANLRSGNTKACGDCTRAARATKHGESDTPMHNLWQNVKGRCAHDPDYADVSVAPEWADDYVAFRDWILANLGERPDEMTLDRIDPNGDYEPGNLRWASRLTQARNKRGSRERVAQLKRERDDLAALVLRLLEIE